MRYVAFEDTEESWARRVGRLRFGFSKWDVNVAGRSTVPRGALVLTRDEHAEIARASEALFALADRFSERWARDDAATRALGVPRALARLAPAGARGGRVTRIDFFLTRDGWRVSEFNDDAPGGYNDALGLPAVLADLVPDGLDVPGDLPDALARLLAPRAGERVGLVYATAYAEDLQVVRLLAQLVAAAGAEPALASPAHLAFDAGEARLAGERVDRVHRFYPCEWFPLLDDLGAWEAAVAAGLPVANPFRVAWTQSKASFARLHAEATGADRALVEAYLPATRALTRETAAEVERDRSAYVLKPAFGRMGEGVSLGSDASPDGWRKAIAAALHRARPYVLQERFAPVPVEVAPGATRTPCVGAYVVDGRFAGYYSRLSERSVVAYDAANVLTLVERV